MAKFLVFPDGKEIPIVKDGGRYWITADSQYSKANPDIKVKRVKDKPSQAKAKAKTKEEEAENADSSTDSEAEAEEKN